MAAATIAWVALALPPGAWWLARGAEPWAVMWAIAGALFISVKALTARGHAAGVSRWRVLAYVAAWPGMDATGFLQPAGIARVGVPRIRELALAVTKTTLGFGAVIWAATRLDAGGRETIAAWIGMCGIVLTLHFGLFHLMSWAWRRAGVDAPPIMRAPLFARSVSDFWGRRWNTAFADAARQLVFKPVSRRLNSSAALVAVFVVSGLVHEAVISIPAGAGYGGPTFYFLLQAGGLFFERHRFGRRTGLGHGWRGRLWAIAVTVLPVPLLLHPPFIDRVIIPFLEDLARLFSL
jgi:hypothetical protein